MHLRDFCAYAKILDGQAPHSPRLQESYNIHTHARKEGRVRANTIKANNTERAWSAETRLAASRQRRAMFGVLERPMCTLARTPAVARSFAAAT